MIVSIKSKFIFFSIFLIILTTVIPMYYLVRQQKENFKEHSKLMQNITLDVVRFSLKSAMLSGKQEYLSSIIKDISAHEGISHIRIISKKGIIDFASDSTEIGNYINNILTEHSNLNLSDIKNQQKEFKGNVYTSLEPLNNKKLCQGCHKGSNIIAYLDINTELTPAETKFYTSTSHMVFLAWVLIIILIVGLYLIFNKNIYLPLQKLNLAINDVQKGNLKTKLEFKNENEITSVYKHFNEMTKNLDSSRDQIEQLHFEALQRVNRFKTIGELSSQTAHEINNHIAVIMSRTEYLELECEKDEKFAKYKEDFNTLLNQINNISTITKNILKYSKKDSKNIRKINLHKIVEDTIQLVKPILKKKDITIINSSICDECFINADELQVKQIITNLINNSVDAIDKKGHIEILIFKNKSGNFILTVKDDGSGIKKEIKGEIFLPFFTTKDSESRTGLGLYIIKKLCDMHKAEIEVISEENLGTSFKITFKKA